MKLDDTTVTGQSTRPRKPTMIVPVAAHASIGRTTQRGLRNATARMTTRKHSTPRPKTMRSWRMKSIESETIIGTPPRCSSAMSRWRSMMRRISAMSRLCRSCSFRLWASNSADTASSVACSPAVSSRSRPASRSSLRCFSRRCQVSSRRKLTWIAVVRPSGLMSRLRYIGLDRNSCFARALSVRGL